MFGRKNNPLSVCTHAQRRVKQCFVPVASAVGASIIFVTEGQKCVVTRGTDDQGRHSCGQQNVGYCFSIPDEVDL